MSEEHITRDQLLRRIAELEVTNMELKGENMKLIQENLDLRVARAHDQQRLFHYERMLK